MKRIASVRILSGLFALALGFAAKADDGFTVLHTFNGVDGASPYGNLVQDSDGAFYGTTERGGAHDLGEVYKLDASGNFSILHWFDAEAEAAYPTNGLVLMDDGNFYGTSIGKCNGSPCNPATDNVFRVTPDGTLTILHTFTESIGSVEVGPLTAGRDGLLYGMTRSGGSDDKGSVYAIATDGTYLQLVNFNGANGSTPYGALIEGADGNFYGTTNHGGGYDSGTVLGWPRTARLLRSTVSAAMTVATAHFHTARCCRAMMAVFTESQTVTTTTAYCIMEPYSPSPPMAN